MGETVLTAKGLVKTYGGVVALNRMDFELAEGEVHCLLGANGCGKSTLCKVIAGVVRPDEGQLTVYGRTFSSLSPEEAKREGVSVVYQELSLIPQLTVEENILLGVEPRKRGGFVDAERRTELCFSYLDFFKTIIPLTDEYLRRQVFSLPPDERQIVEIAKVLARDGKIIIFDEATASFHKDQVDIFFNLIADLKRRSKAIIVISHKMDEIQVIGDRATIMRNGSLAGVVEVKKTSPAEIVNLMTGSGRNLHVEKEKTGRKGDPVLEVRDLSAEGLRNISFTLHAGEILGLGGLADQGQTELLLSLFGAVPMRSGTVSVKGRPFRASSPHDALHRSLAYISGDRKTSGVFLIRSIFDNFISSFLIKKRKKTFSRKRSVSLILPFIQKINLKYGKISDPVSSLSGGTQQKVIIGKWLMTEPEVLLLDDPTKGIDVHTTAEFYEIVKRLCNEGCSIIWNSSEDRELLENTDRILVFNGGEIVDELSGDRLTEFELYKAALTVGGQAAGKV